MEIAQEEYLESLSGRFLKLSNTTFISSTLKEPKTDINRQIARERERESDRVCVRVYVCVCVCVDS